ncbi:MAG TPA: hypothetical protein VMZ50_05730 [Phycisphaerae bacterium]|nr:hypothetical protein [Phycisphaerae bacterium]
MAGQAGRFGWIAKFARLMLMAKLIFFGLLLIATVAVGLAVTLNVGQWGARLIDLGIPPWAIPAAALLAVLAELVAAGWLVVLYGLVHVLLSGESAAQTVAARLGRIESLLTNQAESTGKLADLATLSDRAKSLVYRDREVEAFREIIQEDLMRQDYDTAEILIENMEKNGYADEAARLRREVQAFRKASMEEKIDAAVLRIQQIISRRNWAQALRESQRILRIFPENPKIASLPGRIEAARTKHKRSLLQEYGEAIRKNDIDHGIELLRELDRYLSPQEAAALEESARGVFRAKLHNLGVQFAISVTDEQWAAAVATGEEIIREFPNTRMAQEVREKMDLLRSRAQPGDSSQDHPSPAQGRSQSR